MVINRAIIYLKNLCKTFCCTIDKEKNKKESFHHKSLFNSVKSIA